MKNIKENGKMESSKVQEYATIKMETDMKGNGKIMLRKGLASTTGMIRCGEGGGRMG